MRALVVLLLLAGFVPAEAAQMSLTPGLVHASLPVPVVLPDGRRVVLDGMVLRPDRPGRFPLVLMVHGTPRSDGRDAAALRAKLSPESFLAPAVVFAQRGYAVVSVLRRGFGRSGGEYAEQTVGRCGNVDPLPPARASGEDVAAAVASLRAMSWVDPGRVLLLGVSTGGMAVTAAAAVNPPGVVGVIDFAGGRGSPAPDQVCSPGRLADAFGAFGRTARVPAIWIYAENDHFFGPDLARRMFEAYAAGGAPARLLMLPPFGADGHRLLMAGPEGSWWPDVAGFLASLHLPTGIVIDLPPLPPLRQPPFLNGLCKSGWVNFALRRSATKAFASGPSGNCGWVLGAETEEEAEDQAMANCSLHGTGCRLDAVGHAMVDR